MRFPFDATNFSYHTIILQEARKEYFLTVVFSEEMCIIEKQEGVMKRKEILKHVDHTLLKAAASRKEIEKLCEEAVKYHTASVCVPSSYVRRIRGEYPTLRICTVVGFPLGNGSTEAKAAEIIHALEDGANEIDMVINIGAVKSGDYDYVTSEIAFLKALIGERILKVIVETCYLTEEEKIKVCKCVTDGGADYIKTSTGFGTGGATVEDVKLFKKYIGKNVKIKASGGIHTREEMETYLSLGVDRIGASGAVRLLASKGGCAEAADA